MFYIVGLGNPGEEYELTRHNTGRLALAEFIKNNKVELEFNKKLNALADEGKLKKAPSTKLGTGKFQVIFPEGFINKSGLSLKPIVNQIVRKKNVYPVGKRIASFGAENLIVVHDDLDLPLGRIKISFGKDSAGHRGVESIIKNIKTKNFIRVRVGISPATPSGKIRKPDSKKVIDFIIGKFKPAELATIKKESKKIAAAIEMIIKEGLQKAMSVCH